MTQSESQTGMQLPHWGNVNVPHWQRIGPPLRPGPDDTAAYEREVIAWSRANRGRAPLACVFGATPELAALRWPAGSRVFAIDRSPEILDRVWYWGAPVVAGAIAAEWQHLPLMPASVDLVLGDGILLFVSWRSEHLEVLGGAAHVLKQGGRLVSRTYLRPDTPETVEQVVNDLLAGRIGNFTAFKWRLVGAVHGESDGIPVSEVWDAWEAAGLCEEEVAERLGFPLRVVRTMRAYRGLNVRYTLPTLAQLEEMLRAQPWFNVAGCHALPYELGERFRLIALEKR